MRALLILFLLVLSLSAQAAPPTDFPSPCTPAPNTKLLTLTINRITDRPDDALIDADFLKYAGRLLCDTGLLDAVAARLSPWGDAVLPGPFTAMIGLLDMWVEALLRLPEDERIGQFSPNEFSMLGSCESLLAKDLDPAVLLDRLERASPAVREQAIAATARLIKGLGEPNWVPPKRPTRDEFERARRAIAETMPAELRARVAEVEGRTVAEVGGERWCEAESAVLRHLPKAPKAAQLVYVDSIIYDVGDAEIWTAFFDELGVKPETSEYPALAAALGIEGTVKVSFEVGVDGKPSKLTIVERRVHFQERPERALVVLTTVFDKGTLERVARASYSTHRKDGKSAPYQARQEYDWKLRK